MSHLVHIGVIRDDALGDAVLSCYLLAMIKQRWPAAKLSIIATESLAPLLLKHTAVDAVIPTVSGLYAKYKLLKSEKLTHLFFARMNPAYVWAGWLAGVPIRVGDRNIIGLRPLLTHSVSLDYSNWRLHEANFQANLLSPFVDDTRLPNTVTHFEPATLSQRLSQQLNTATKQRPYVIIHPGFGAANRGWPVANYRALCQYLATQYTVILIGMNQSLLAAISQHTPAINLCQQTSLIDMMALIQDAALVIGPDTGPVHLANLLRVPVIYISPLKYIRSWRWGPCRPPGVIVKFTDYCFLRCNPHKQTCDSLLCIQPLTLDRVKTAIKQVLDPTAMQANLALQALQTDGRIAIHCQTIASIEIARQLYNRYYTQTITSWLTMTSRPVYSVARQQGLPCFYIENHQIRTWVRHLQHTLIWHVPHPTLWHKLITTLASLRTDEKPMLVTEYQPVSV